MCIIILFISILFSQEIEFIDEYHSYEEIQNQLILWDQEFGENSGYSESNYSNSGFFYKLDTLGYSTNKELPIWVVKLSSNINETVGNKPKILILGQCHSEEIYGVEIAMGIINIFLHPDADLPFRPSSSQINKTLHLNRILNDAEIWVIPTYNPEGLQVVHGFEENNLIIHDVSYRKNSTDVNGNGIFDFQNLSDNGITAGGDFDGIDLNRNYDFNWIFGDKAGQLDNGCTSDDNIGNTYHSDYDYYRGEFPFSENEVRIIRDLTLDNIFLFSIAYHSSRSGCVSEKVVFPWMWKDQLTEVQTSKSSPDYIEIKNIADDLAEILDYQSTWSKSMRGNAHDWLYSQTGCIQYLIETGTGGQEGMQTSDVNYLNQVIKDNILAAFYLMNRTAGNTSGDGSVIRPKKTLLTGIVKNSITSEIIQGAEVTIVELSGPMLKNRNTDGFGRFRRPVSSGNYNIHVNADGFKDTIIQAYASLATISDIEINLIPKNEFIIFFTLNGSDYAELYVSTKSTVKDTLSLSSGQNNIQLYEDEYLFWVIADDKAPAFFEINLNQNRYVTISLEDEVVYYSEEFNALNNWTISEGVGFVADGTLTSPHQNDAYVESTSLLYDNNMYTNIISLEPIQNTMDGLLTMIIDGGYELEWDIDQININLVSKNDTIYAVNWSGHNWEPFLSYYSVNLEEDKQYYLHISLESDSTIVYRGINVDKIRIVGGDNNIDLGNPTSFKLSENYPNPFNPSTTISFELVKSDNIKLQIIDIRGKLVETIIDNKIYPSGKHDIIYSPKNFSSGNYFYKLISSNGILVSKMTYLK